MPSGVPADEYHERTKHTPRSVQGGPGLDFDNRPRPYKLYADRPRIPLGDAIPEPDVPALRAIVTRGTPDSADRADVDKATLAGACYYAGGITKEFDLRNRTVEYRAAACTGNLHHVDLYPVCGDLPGLDAGVYHFDPRTNALDVLRAGDYRGVLADATELPSVERAPVTVIATSTWWRNAWKYRARTYRHAFWDSGTVLANLLATAHAGGRPAAVVTGFADGPVADLLGVDPEWEAPLELVPIGTGDPAPDASPTESIDPATEPLDSDPVEYPHIHEAWQESTLPDGATARAWRSGGPRPVDGHNPGGGERVTLDPVGPETESARPLHNTITRRGSCREYERDHLSFRKVSTVLDRATRGVPMDVRTDEDADGSDPPALQFVDCYCIVTGVEGVDPGAYQYHPDAGDLELLHAGEYREAAGRLALGQALAADAAMCLYLMADLDAITDALGNRGYRVAQLEAALTAGRLYLATYAHRTLGGTGLTFFDDHVTEFFAPRTAGQTPMFLYTIGRPA